MSDNEEALFDDIYAEEEVKEESKDIIKPADETKAEEDVKREEQPDSEEVKKEQNSNDTKDDTTNSSEGPTSSAITANDAQAPVNTESQSQVPQSQGQDAPDSAVEIKRKADLSREGGKMFIGGLDWDTDEDRLKEYFSQYGEVVEHTIMREASTGRSRGFGFLTFADAASVREVLKTQHVLDGKVIDPKRSIPREEQDKTGKIFVGGIAPEVRPHEYEAFFSKFGTIIDAQLMLDKDTGKSRGFGFITFDSSDAVDRVCQGRYLDFNGKQIEVKRAEPRGPQQQQNHIAQQQQRYLQQGGYRNNRNLQNSPPVSSAASLMAAPQQNNYYGVTPEAMNEYYQNMAQYWAQLQQQQQQQQQQGGVQADQFAQYAQQFQMMQQMQQQQQQQQLSQAGDQGAQAAPPPPPSAQQEPPINAPRGPRGGRGGRGRGRGSHRASYHPYQR